MQTISIPKFGGPEVLEKIEKPEPRPGPGEVSLDVAYAGVNYAEVLFRKGVVPGLEMPFTPGIEASGYVRELGEGITGLQVGQRVAALTIVGGGGYAEVAVAPASLVVPLPNDLPLDVAAAFPSNTTTAYMVLHDVAPLEPDETVVVHAAAGGVGSVLGQMARALGAGNVIGVVGSPGKAEYAKSLGYDHVVSSEGFREAVQELTEDRGADIVIDQVGGVVRRPSLDLLRPGGRLVVMGNASEAEDVPLSPLELWFASKAVLGFNLGLLSATDPRRVSAAMQKAMDLLASGEVRVDVTGVLALADATVAHRRIEGRKTTGKLVLQVSAEGA